MRALVASPVAPMVSSPHARSPASRSVPAGRRPPSAALALDAARTRRVSLSEVRTSVEDASRGDPTSSGRAGAAVQRDRLREVSSYRRDGDVYVIGKYLSNENAA
ncbi:hypothetical protein [Sorangium sp. So ce385]|uniref:hypothetical protein n=1 Tax=Sorangium sp. So ce385 TaxID=3133308 RepID=UPI003F5CB2EE